MQSSLCIGIDLHGTLLPSKTEQIPTKLLKPLKEAIKALRENHELFICTGNDLGFVKRKIPASVLELFDGMVLETGCVASNGESEEVLVSEKIVKQVKELEGKLKDLEFPQVYKFARRLATISLFTCFGQEPEILAFEVSGFVKEFGFGNVVRVTYSSVAVDLVPKEFNKLSGLMFFAKENKTVAIADSMNDLEFPLGADFAFIPKNASPKLEKILEKERGIESIGNAEKLEKKVIKTRNAETAGVIEALRFVNRCAMP